MKNNVKMRSTNEQCTAEERHGFAHPFLILAFTFLISHFSFLTSNAQTFTDRLQQPAAGQGKVTIHQSADIDQLVNNATLAPRQAATTNTQHPSPNTQHPSPNTQPPSPNTTQHPSPNTQQSTAPDTPTANEAPVDNTKKIMRGGVKVNGYRVQAFAGGNSRKDRQQAEKIGDDIKAAYPDVPIYVHFYSPRWICRVGNYRSYEEAHQMLVSLRKMGFSQATIVKGKITVPSY